MITVDKYNVRIVRKGDKYGRDFCLTHDKEEKVRKACAENIA